MKKILTYGMTFSLAGLAIMGMALASINVSHQEEFHKSIKLNSEGNASLTWDINLSGLYPGQSVTYDLDFANNLSKNVEVSINFKKGENISLANFLNLSITYNDETIIKQDMLANYFLLDDLNFSATNSLNNIKFTYLMPLETTNEAQRQIVDFSLTIDIKGQVN